MAIVAASTCTGVRSRSIAWTPRRERFRAARSAPPPGTGCAAGFSVSVTKRWRLRSRPAGNWFYPPPDREPVSPRTYRHPRTVNGPQPQYGGAGARRTHDHVGRGGEALVEPRGPDLIDEDEADLGQVKGWETVD